MTKIKKTLALMMVLVMAMTTLVLPASAVTPEEEMQPYVAYKTCPNCGGDVPLICTSGYFSGVVREIVYTANHKHQWEGTAGYCTCSDCGADVYHIFSMDTTAHCTAYPCPFGQ